MKTIANMFTNLSIASLALAIGACVVTPQKAPGIASPLAAADEEIADEWVSDCRQELGLDSGDAHRAHPLADDEWVSGCFVNGDNIDAFAIEVPAAAQSATYQIEFVHRGGSPLAASLVTEDGNPLAQANDLREGAHINRSLILKAGRRYMIRVAKAPGASSAWYRLKAAPVTQVAAK